MWCRDWLLVALVLLAGVVLGSAGAQLAHRRCRRALASPARPTATVRTPPRLHTDRPALTSAARMQRPPRTPPTDGRRL
jgi:hypothetical protein